jgi:hypothetical protein
VGGTVPAVVAQKVPDLRALYLCMVSPAGIVTRSDRMICLLFFRPYLAYLVFHADHEDQRLGLLDP